jgi:hypothetical protein
MLANTQFTQFNERNNVGTYWTVIVRKARTLTEESDASYVKAD